jgi:hypothetical protein
MLVSCYNDILHFYTQTKFSFSSFAITCGLPYCEKCGKLVNKRHAGIERRITIHKAMNEYWSQMNTDRNISALPLTKSMSIRRRRRHTEETRLKISRANKGKHLGCVPWN